MHTHIQSRTQTGTHVHTDVHRQTDTAQMYIDKRNGASGLVTNINVCLPFYTQVTFNDQVYNFKGALKQQKLQHLVHKLFNQFSFLIKPETFIMLSLALTSLLLCYKIIM